MASIRGSITRRHLAGNDHADPGFALCAGLRKPIQQRCRTAPGRRQRLCHSAIVFTNGEVHAISWSTRRPGGFDDGELAAFDAVAAHFARATEIYCLRRTAVTFLDTYVGHGAGGRILSENIQRGDVQEMDAVILAANLRGFTHYIASHDWALVVERLNALFDILVAPITARGGGY